VAARKRRKTTVYVDEELLRSAKVLAARTDRKEYEVFEEALRSYLSGKTSGEAEETPRQRDLRDPDRLVESATHGCRETDGGRMPG
jgi:hypothetical protein